MVPTIDAFNLIRLGKANVIVAGGAEAAICESGVGGFNAMHALSTRNDEPEKASRPFSASRDGFIMAEGSGCLILEELEHAKARGAKIPRISTISTYTVLLPTLVISLRLRLSRKYLVMQLTSSISRQQSQ